MTDPDTPDRAANGAPDPGVSVRQPLTVGDWMLPITVFAFCAVVTWLSFQMEEANQIIVGHAMQPRVYPVFLMAITAALGLVLTVQLLNQGHRPRGQLTYQTFVTIALSWLFYLIASQLDFFLGLAVAMFFMALVWGERRWWVALLLAVAAPLVTFLIFDLVLGKRFPRGILTNLYYGA